MYQSPNSPPSVKRRQELLYKGVFPVAKVTKGF